MECKMCGENLRPIDEPRGICNWCVFSAAQQDGMEKEDNE